MSETPAAPAHYDALAAGYARHWGPVIRPAAVAVLDRLDDPPRASRVLDVGTGTGSLAIEVLSRWPSAAVTGVDISDAMLDLARLEAERRFRPRDLERFQSIVAPADRLPFADDAFDVAISSFVLQLVPSRAAALGEIHRVVRPGGRLAWVTWLVGGERFRADGIVDEVLDEFGFDPPERDDRSGDLASVAAAAQATRRAGFRDVTAEANTLTHRWDPAAYERFIVEFDEAGTFDSLDSAERRAAERQLLKRLRALSPEELTMRLPLVYATGVAR